MGSYRDDGKENGNFCSRIGTRVSSAVKCG